MPTPPPARQPSHRERLWPSPAFWGASPLMGVLVLVSLLPVGRAVAGAAAVLVAALVAAALVRGSALVEVTDGGELVVGRARLPLRVVAGARGARGEDARRLRGPELDARTFRCIRGWIDGVVLVELDDPEDPTPAWIVSTRRPEQLAAALAAGARRPRDGGAEGRGGVSAAS